MTVSGWIAASGWLVGAAGCLAAVLCAVRLGRVRRAFARTTQERGWLLERDRETAARQAVDAERARIARELHDIVSHNVSIMLVQAGAARQVLSHATHPTRTATASTPDTDTGVGVGAVGLAVEAMLAVEGAGRDTMTELRHLLGVLAPSAESDGDLSAPPSLRRLSPLVDRIAFAGLPVEVRVSGEPRPLPSGVDVTAYRIIQEALTNALRHAAGGKAEVLVRYADRSLRVEVLNTGPSVLTADPSRPGPSRPAQPDTSSGPPTGVPVSDPGSRSTAGVPWSRTDPPDMSDRSGAEGGRGLVGLRQRVAVFGGDLDARRRLGGGFRVRARIPLEPP